MKKTTFSIYVSTGFLTKEIAWPIVQETPKALLVQTPGGEIWLPLWRFNGKCIRCAASKPDEAIDLLSSLTSSHLDALVPVWKAGTGSSAKSHKFHVEIFRPIDSSDPDSGREIVRRCFTLPKSQIKEIDGVSYAPVWLFKKRLAQFESLRKPRWQGMELIAACIREFAAGVEKEHKENQERQVALAAQRNEEFQKTKLELEELNLQLGSNGKAELAFCKQKRIQNRLQAAGINPQFLPAWPPYQAIPNLRMALSFIEFARQQKDFAEWEAKFNERQDKKIHQVKKIRLPDRILENVRVEWVEWGGTSKARVKNSYESEDCTVRVFGKKHEIELPDGQVVIKMAGPNLKIGAPSNKPDCS